MPDLNQQYEGKQRKLIAALTKKIKKIYQASIVNISFATSTTPIKDGKFTLSAYPAIEKKIEQELKRMHKEIYSAVLGGVNQSWGNSNKKNDLIVDRRLASRRASKRARQILYDPNKQALDAFISRKEKGLGLSDRVWKSLKTFRNELEQGLGLGIGEGSSAKSLASELKKYLDDPERLFRRVRGEDGKLKLSAAARSYHPGKGVYRSSYKNALRLTRTETNVAYRTADFTRWQQLPFVVGIEIRLSAQHPRYDICDSMVGRYPKDFLFKGWHPQCICYAVPIMMSDEEYSKIEDQILAGEAIDVKSSGLVSRVPKGFEEWVRLNKNRVAGWSNTPYWVKDNPEYYRKASNSRRKRDDPKGTEPSGNPIGVQFTQIATGIRGQVRRAFDHIDSVHGDGIMKDIPIVRVSRQDFQAAFGMVGKDPYRIMLSTKATDPELSLIHEMGHYLDFYAISSKGQFASHTSGSPAGQVVATARQSKAIQSLQDIVDTGHIAGSRISPNLEKHIEYLLSDHEIFARGYAQYISVKTRNEKLKDGIKRRLDYEKNTGLLYQWQEGDFDDIFKAFDEMMEKLGWINR